MSYSFLGGNPNDAAATGNNVVLAAIENISGTLRAGTIDVTPPTTAASRALPSRVSGRLVALGGAVSVQNIRTTPMPTSERRDVTSTSNVANSIRVKAEDTSAIAVYSGGAGLAIPKDDGTGIAAGVSIAINDVVTSTKGYIDNAKVTSTAPSKWPRIRRPTSRPGPSASRSPTARAARASRAASGAGSGNTIDSTVEAYILNSNGTRSVFANGGGITITATNNSDILAVAGTLALARTLRRRGQCRSIGISVAENETRTRSTPMSRIPSSTPPATYRSRRRRRSQDHGHTVGGSIARSKKITVAIGVTIALNDINANVKAYISGSTDVVTTGLRQHQA